ncbi:MAG: hypothetical protein Q9170_003817 [Blastenia crenularia]
MADPSQQRLGKDISRDWSSDGADLASAISASLGSPGWSSSKAPDSWIPQSIADWNTYRRQKRLEEEARNATSANEPKSVEDLQQRPSGPDVTSSGNKTPQMQVDSSALRSETENGPPKDPDPYPSTTENSFNHSSPPRPTIDDMIKEIELRNATIELPWFDDSDGDTFVYIDAPDSKQPEQTDRIYTAYVERYRRPFIVSSTTLKHSQSSFLNKRLGPDAQFRILRRRKLKDKLPAHIKYVIDLTPPTEGDEAAWLTSELCCMDGLRNWSQGELRWQISKTLVGGWDEYTAPSTNEDGTYSAPEYSPIRHRASIERVLNAIRGIDPKLDSAAKVYTTFVVARFLDIKQNSLSDYIIRWLRAPPNSLFIEAFPEVALKIGDGLQCSELIQDAFAILVGEEALELMRGKPSPDFTAYGRKKNDVPESYKTRIEYASKSLQDRVSRTFDALVDRDMMWMENLPEFRKLLDGDNSFMTHLLTEAKLALKAFVRGAIYVVLYSQLTWAPGLWLGANGGDSLYPRTNRHEFWNELDRSKRIMTTSFWEALKTSCPTSFTKFSNQTNLTVWAQNTSEWHCSLSNDNRKTLIREQDVSEVRHAYLRELATKCCQGQAYSSATYVGTIRPLARQPRDFWEPALPALAPKPETWPAVTPSVLQPPFFFWSDSAETRLDPPRSPKRKIEEMDESMGKEETISDQLTASKNSRGININLMQFHIEVSDYLRSVCDSMLSPPDTERTDRFRPELTLTLICLDQQEMKYLPLYAGGFDDGSGGVFNDDVPSAETGFSTAGPAVHTGTTNSDASSEFDVLDPRDLESTRNTSTMMNDGFSDQMDRGKVYDGDDDLWNAVMREKDGNSSRTASHVELDTMVTPSKIDAESEDGFVIPIRTKQPDAGPSRPLDEVPATNNGNDLMNLQMDEDDYDDIFADTNEVQDDDIDLEDEDDDTATEKGDNEHELSDDEDLMII